MKRIGVAMWAAWAFMMAMAAPAMAGSEIPAPKSVKPAQVAAERVLRGLAFTGADIPLWLAIAGVLLVLGVVFLVLGHRRASASR